MPRYARSLALGAALVLAGGWGGAQEGPPEGAEVKRTFEPIGLGLWRWGVEWSYSGLPPWTSDSSSLPRIEIRNPSGGIRVMVKATKELEIRAASAGRAVTGDDVVAERAGASFGIVVQPPDDAAIDLKVVAPYGMFVVAATASGGIEYTGFGRADLRTDYGDVVITAPLEATRFELLTIEEPGSFEGHAKVTSSDSGWSARERLPRSRMTYGQILLRAQRPRSIRLRELGGIPEDSPIKMHWQAAGLLPKLFWRFGSSGLKRRKTQEPVAASEPTDATFSANVRLVQLDLSVIDKEGRPVAGLGAEDFEVIEAGTRQRLMEVASGETAFNLVLLLDCSSSTERDRPAMEQAARRFVDIAREQDRVGIYALADSMFQVLSPLTRDHEAARASVASLRGFGGGTPLYDTLVLAYAEELSRLRRQRNAIVVLTDGMDNSLDQMVGLPSVTQFSDFKKAVQEMDVLIYPIVLGAGTEPIAGRVRRRHSGRPWTTVVKVRDRAEALAKASGGRVFFARSLADLDDVYRQVAEELRSVYTLTYSPTNQNFDGKWRKVRVRTGVRGIAVRKRPGYYAY